MKKLFLIPVMFLIWSNQVFAETNGGLGQTLLDWLGLGQSPQTTITPSNKLGMEINDLYGLVTYISVAIFLIIVVIFFIIAFKFREKVHPEPEEEHGSIFMELFWTILPVVIVVILAVPTISLVFKIRKVPDLSSRSTLVYEYKDQVEEFNKYLEITAIGHQWWWEFEYEGYHTRKFGDKKETFIPINKVTANEPWLPVGIPIKVNLISEDVIHSFWVPKLSGKVDVLPGQKNSLAFIIEEEGNYWGQCAEYCGASHAFMRFNVQGVSQEKFDEWLNWGKGILVVGSEKAQKGQVLFGTCLTCHSLNGMKTHIKRRDRLAEDLPKYDEAVSYYQNLLRNWEAQKRQEGVFHHGIEYLEAPTRPVAPEKPEPYKGHYKTIAPDLTDLRFRNRILAGIQDNTRENLKNWIKDPGSQKPEIKGTPVIRMIPYMDIFNDEEIDSVIEFLMTLEYTESPAPIVLDNPSSPSSIKVSYVK